MPVTDEDAAIQAITSFTSPTREQREAQAKINTILASDDPFIDIHEVFKLYNVLYFRSLLIPRVEVSWSPRLTLCAGKSMSITECPLDLSAIHECHPSNVNVFANFSDQSLQIPLLSLLGICELVRDSDNGNKYSRIRLKLSEPLLKYRPRSDVLNTLLHECIHAYFFIITSWRHSRGDDGTSHGAGFLLLADAINDRDGYDITVYHTFHDEVDSYRTHIWQCDGPCKSEAPYFGLVKRSMNRPPGKSDTWWTKHQEECAGTFTKIAEPGLTKEQVERLSGRKKAGMQKNKLDKWISKTGPTTKAKRSLEEVPHDEPNAKRLRQTACPICEEEMALEEINAHLDEKHSS